MDDFDRTVLVRLEGLFDADEIQTLTFRAGAGQPARDAAVKVVQNPTGAEVVCNDVPSQIKNNSIALLDLFGLLRCQS